MVYINIYILDSCVQLRAPSFFWGGPLSSPPSSTPWWPAISVAPSGKKYVKKLGGTFLGVGRPHHAPHSSAPWQRPEKLEGKFFWKNNWRIGRWWALPSPAPPGALRPQWPLRDFSGASLGRALYQYNEYWSRFTLLPRQFLIHH